MNEIKFLVPNKIKHLKDISKYNLNYYKLEDCGDWVVFHGNDILEERYFGGYETYEYSFGRFNDDKFIPVLTFSSDVELALEK